MLFSVTWQSHVIHEYDVPTYSQGSDVTLVHTASLAVLDYRASVSKTPRETDRFVTTSTNVPITMEGVLIILFVPTLRYVLLRLVAFQTETYKAANLKTFVPGIIPLWQL